MENVLESPEILKYWKGTNPVLAKDSIQILGQKWEIFSLQKSMLHFFEIMEMMLLGNNTT